MGPQDAAETENDFELHDVAHMMGSFIGSFQGADHGDAGRHATLTTYEDGTTQSARQ